MSRVAGPAADRPSLARSARSLPVHGPMKKFAVGFAAGLIVGVPAVLALLAGIGHALQIDDRLDHADAIVAISGDTGPRAATAVELWRQGYADRIVFSGGSVDPASAPSAELMKRQAMLLGVPAERIVLETTSTSTAENAVNVAEMMNDAGLRSAILVTSPYHQRRASLHFAREFARYGISLRNHPADDPSWDPNVWWMREPARSLTVVELAKLAIEAADGDLRRSPSTPHAP